MDRTLEVWPISASPATAARRDGWSVVLEVVAGLVQDLSAEVVGVDVQRGRVSFEVHVPRRRSATGSASVVPNRLPSEGSEG